MKIFVINGPNLNLTGIREPQIYGTESFDTWLPVVQAQHPNTHIEYYQSNVEGEIINELQKVAQDTNCIGVVLNAGAYTHTSIAIADAVAAIPISVIAVHMSNPLSREPERHTDLLLGKCLGVISGLGMKSYELAIGYFVKAQGK
ncbi:MAG: type II 3-dehydroquinate dehydratase [Bacteroidetes bacterium]|nr:type II 3-dehydroquinate dehydratase [Bacteroidota bacterium]